MRTVSQCTGSGLDAARKVQGVIRPLHCAMVCRCHRLVMRLGRLEAKIRIWVAIYMISALVKMGAEPPALPVSRTAPCHPDGPSRTAAVLPRMRALPALPTGPRARTHTRTRTQLGLGRRARSAAPGLAHARAAQPLGLAHARAAHAPRATARRVPMGCATPGAGCCRPGHARGGARCVRAADAAAPAGGCARFQQSRGRDRLRSSARRVHSARTARRLRICRASCSAGHVGARRNRRRRRLRQRDAGGSGSGSGFPTRVERVAASQRLRIRAPPMHARGRCWLGAAYAGRAVPVVPHGVCRSGAVMLVRACGVTGQPRADRARAHGYAKRVARLARSSFMRAAVYG